MSDTRTPPGRPDISHLETENEFMVNIPTDKQKRLLIEPLYTSWRPGCKFLATANINTFPGFHTSPFVPTVLLSLDVDTPRDQWAKENRTYSQWEFGKAPDVAIHLVSLPGGQTLDLDPGFSIPYCAVYAPQAQQLTCYGLRGGEYVKLPDGSLPNLGLQLVVWEGPYEGRRDKWLRWADEHGKLIPTGAEHCTRADALAESRRANALAERLRQLGVDPDTV